MKPLEESQVKCINWGGGFSSRNLSLESDLCSDIWQQPGPLGQLGLGRGIAMVPRVPSALQSLSSYRDPTLQRYLHAVGLGKPAASPIF